MSTATTEDLGGVAGWAVDVMERLGAPGAGLLIALENLFPPLPSELILPLAGFTASRGDIGLVDAIVWTTLGSVVGALVLYAAGARLGAARIEALVDRLPLLEVDDVRRTVAWFERHGDKAVFLGRFVPLFRSLISIPAGVSHMGVVRFTVLTAVGSAIWNTAFVLAGYELGNQWERVEGWLSPVQNIVIVVVVVAVVWFGAHRWVRKRREAKAERAEASGSADPVDQEG
ncbi:DedA family protein [Nocardioides litoris]|uniref:DedA family protein n=1 Tax=Nocardioides litoris TaxID=1926648 RepID=UPI001FE59F70|nr:DedA family protein [Nocardioides litoris]